MTTTAAAAAAYPAAPLTLLHPHLSAPCAGRACRGAISLPTNAVQRGEAECNNPCPGNSSQICGGTKMTSVYSSERAAGSRRPRHACTRCTCMCRLVRNQSLGFIISIDHWVHGGRVHDHTRTHARMRARGTHACMRVHVVLHACSMHRASRPTLAQVGKASVKAFCHHCGFRTAPLRTCSICFQPTAAGLLTECPPSTTPSPRRGDVSWQLHRLPQQHQHQWVPTVCHGLDQQRYLGCQLLYNELDQILGSK